METMQVNLNKSQVMRVVRSMSDADKLEIYKELKKSLFLNRFNNLSASLKTDRLSMEDIDREVKTVRRRRYESGK